MKKQLTAVCLIVALLLMSIPMAGASSQVNDLTATPIDSTSLSVAWNGNSSDEPLYTVVCTVDGTDRSTERRTYHTNCTINYLSPDTTYVITVSTKDGSSESVTVTIPAAASYTDFNYTLLETGVYQSTQYDDDYSAVTTFSASTLEEGLSTYDFSILLRFKLASTTQNKYLDFELVLTMPNGDSYTVSDVLWYAASRTTVTEYFAFDSAIRKILNDYDEIPTGEYTLTAYIDNGFAAETTFTVE